MDSDSSEEDNGNYVRMNREYPAYLCLNQIQVCLFVSVFERR